MKKIKPVAIVSPYYNEFDVITKFLDELESIKNELRVNLLIPFLAY
jgi:hypothetical protein